MYWPGLVVNWIQGNQQGKQSDSSLSSFSDFTDGRSGGGWLELCNCKQSVANKTPIRSSVVTPR